LFSINGLKSLNCIDLLSGYMRCILTLAYSVYFLALAWGQSEVAIQGCATPGEYHPWLDTYHQSIKQFHQRSGVEILYLPLTIYSVGNTKGEGHISTIKIFESICQINQDFEPYNIQFYLKGDIKKINRDSYYDHDNFSEGRKMMTSYRVTATVNCFITNSAPSDACGYYHPSAEGIVVIKNCLGLNGHTWTHELGHWLSLPHTFYGWEGTTYDSNSKTPDYLKINGFDTTYVERVDGTNCQKSADRFCDTPPDYLSLGWSCNGNNESNVVLKDPRGENFRSDGSNYMSYSLDACQSKFSLDQVDAMRSFLQFVKSNYVNQDILIQDVRGSNIQLNYPVNNEKVHYKTVKLEWNHVVNATKYLVQISRFSFFATIEYEFIVEANSLTISELPNDRRWHWRIKPFNPYDFCPDFSEPESFTTEDATYTEEIDANNSVDVFPTLVSRTNPQVNVQFYFSDILPTQVQLISPAGITMWKEKLPNPGNLNYALSVSDLSAGIYFLQILTESGQLIKKITIQ
jgi:hypothetical protein